MSKANQISAAVVISKGSVVVNNVSVPTESSGLGFSVFAKSLYQQLDLSYPKFFKMDNLCKLGFLTAELVVRQIKNFDAIERDRVGIFLVNKSSSLDTDIRFFETVTDTSRISPSPSLFVYTLPNILIGEISIRHKLTGEHAFFIDDQLDESFLIHYTDFLLGEQKLKGALLGWVDYYKSEYHSGMMWVEPRKFAKDRPIQIDFSPEFFHHITTNLV